MPKYPAFVVEVVVIRMVWLVLPQIHRIRLLVQGLVPIRRIHRLQGLELEIQMQVRVLNQKSHPMVREQYQTTQ